MHLITTNLWNIIIKCNNDFAFALNKIDLYNNQSEIKMPLPLYKKPNSSPVKVFGVAAGKGGVGKSFLSCNLARALKNGGKRVGLLDADLYGPSLKKMMPPEKRAERLNERWTPALSEGIKVLSLAHFCPDTDALTVRSPIASRFIDQFLNQTDWGPLDYLIIDFPPGTGDIQLTLAQKVRLEGILLITTPQSIAISDVRRAASAFLEMNVPLIGLVENMSYLLDPEGRKLFPFGKGGGALLADELSIPLLAEIPLEADLSLYSDRGKSFFECSQPHLKPIQEIFYHLAETLMTCDSQKELYKISPCGPHAFQIEWANGTLQHYELSQLQTLCPCALCQGKGKSSPDVRAVGILEAGRYAIKIDFETGCKNGIYTFDFLKAQGKKL